MRMGHHRDMSFQFRPSDGGALGLYRVFCCHTTWAKVSIPDRRCRPVPRGGGSWRSRGPASLSPLSPLPLRPRQFEFQPRKLRFWSLWFFIPHLLLLPLLLFPINFSQLLILTLLIRFCWPGIRLSIRSALQQLASDNHALYGAQHNDVNCLLSIYHHYHSNLMSHLKWLKGVLKVYNHRYLQVKFGLYYYVLGTLYNII